MRVGIYAGSFDPLTNGHLDIICRAAKLVDELYILVTENIGKNAIFSLDERVEMIQSVIELDHVFVDKTDDLVIRFAKEKKATIIFRGLRNVIDFESEIALFHHNKLLNPNVETVVLFPSHGLNYVSSSVVKELVYYNSDISDYVPLKLVDSITKGIKKKLK